MSGRAASGGLSLRPRPCGGRTEGPGRTAALTEAWMDAARNLR